MIRARPEPPAWSSTKSCERCGIAVDLDVLAGLRRGAPVRDSVSPKEAGVVHEDIEAAELGFDPGDGIVGLVFGGDIECVYVQTGDVSPSSCEPFLVAAGDHDLVPVYEPARELEADPSAASRDHDPLPGEVHLQGRCRCRVAPVERFGG